MSSSDLTVTGIGVDAVKNIAGRETGIDRIVIRLSTEKGSVRRVYLTPDQAIEVAKKVLEAHTLYEVRESNRSCYDREEGCRGR